MRWFDVETGVVIHTANAWDDGDEVVLLASRSNTADIAGAGHLRGNNSKKIKGGFTSGGSTLRQVPLLSDQSARPPATSPG